MMIIDKSKNFKT